MCVHWETTLPQLQMFAEQALQRYEKAGATANDAGYATILKGAVHEIPVTTVRANNMTSQSY